jgi:hypothetical protein
VTLTLTPIQLLDRTSVEQRLDYWIRLQIRKQINGLLETTIGIVFQLSTL